MIDTTVISPGYIWALSGLGVACLISIILGLNLALGTRRRLGIYFVWIGATVLVCAGIAVALFLMNQR